MLDSAFVDNRLKMLKSEDPKDRDLAASEIADLLESDTVDEKVFTRTVPALIRYALIEKDATVKESLFNALSTASMSTYGFSMDWDAIADCLDGLEADCLEHALITLGFSRKPKYLPKIENYHSHPDEAIRQAALDATQMLSPERKHKEKSANRRGTG